MKKKADWMTKAKKRKVKKRDRGIVDVMMLMQHYFKELSLWLYHLHPSRPGSDGGHEKYLCGQEHALNGRKLQ